MIHSSLNYIISWPFKKRTRPIYHVSSEALVAACVSETPKSSYACFPRYSFINVKNISLNRTGKYLLRVGNGPFLKRNRKVYGRNEKIILISQKSIGREGKHVDFEI